MELQFTKILQHVVKWTKYYNRVDIVHIILRQTKYVKEYNEK